MLFYLSALIRSLAFVFLGLLSVNGALAEEAIKTNGLVIPSWSEGWSLGGHWGRAIDNSVESLEAFQPQKWDGLDYAVFSIGGRKELLKFDKYFSIYTELNASFIYGDEDYAEIFLTPTLSWNLFPWDDYLDTSASIGVGLSYALEASDLDGSGEELMASMIFELEFRLPDVPDWSLYTRIHHRSSAYNTFSDGGGSNFPSIGLRYHFN